MRAWSGGAGLASSSAALGLSCPCRALSLCEVFFLPEADAAYSAFAFNASVVAVQVRFCRCDQPGALLRVFSCRRWFRPIVVSGRLLLVCSVFPPRPGRQKALCITAQLQKVFTSPAKEHNPGSRGLSATACVLGQLQTLVRWRARANKGVGVGTLARRLRGSVRARASGFHPGSAP